ncbi:MAG: cytochrome c peroxidase [Ferruginibacter sp.]
MKRILLTAVLPVLIMTVSSFFMHETPLASSQKVKQLYLQYADTFIKQAQKLQRDIAAADDKTLQHDFFRLRDAYKKTETFTEYYFPFYATKLNGPPIVFFEEAESDMPSNLPAGMQVIEGLLFQKRNSKDDSRLQEQADELLRLATELPGVNVSFAFDDAGIFDALVEELYRITALGITGFDSQTAQNSLPECAAALESVRQYTAPYKTMFEEQLPGQYELLQQKIMAAAAYLKTQKDFNGFDRMYFINTFLSPVTVICGRFKTAYGLADNGSGQYYSSIAKNNTLFAKNAFNPYRFIDDYKSSPEKIALGRMLFFDPLLSAGNSRSCASCHQPSKAFTDGLKTSVALDGHTALPRNAPTVWNSALQRTLFADSRSRNLEEQVLQVLNNAKEMHGRAQEAAEKIIGQTKYQRMYSEAFPGSTTAAAAQNICNAIACYERTLIALNSRFDRQMNGESVLNQTETAGFNLFMGKAKCGTCHFMPLFGGTKPPRYYYTESEVIGVPAAKGKKNARLDADSGRFLYTGYPIHLYAFKTPSLRNVALTAPYMHNGVFSTLEEVMDFYNEGGGKGLGIAPANQSLPFDKLHLSAAEKNKVIAFMKTLTDTTGAY